MKPILDNVIVRPDKGEETTDGGIILPGDRQKHVRTGEVVAVGPGKHVGETFIIPSVEPGQRIVYCSTAGIPVKNHSVDYVVMNENSILAILE